MHLQIEMLKLDLLMAVYTFSQHGIRDTLMAFPAKESLGARLA